MSDKPCPRCGMIHAKLGDIIPECQSERITDDELNRWWYDDGLTTVGIKHRLIKELRELRSKIMRLEANLDVERTIRKCAAPISIRRQQEIADLRQENDKLRYELEKNYDCSRPLVDRYRNALVEIAGLHFESAYEAIMIAKKILEKKS